MTDPDVIVLALTHLAAFLSGAAACRWLTVRKLRARKVDGHTVLEVRPHDHAE